MSGLIDVDGTPTLMSGFDRVNATLTAIASLVVIVQAFYPSLSRSLPSFANSIFQGLAGPFISPAEVIIIIILFAVFVRLARKTSTGGRTSEELYDGVPVSIANGNLSYNDIAERDQNRLTLQIAGSSPVVAGMLESRYGRGFINLDCDILRAWLVRGRETPRDISIFLNVDIVEILSRLRLMQEKGVLVLTPASSNSGT